MLAVHWLPLLHLSQVLLDFDYGWVFAPLSRADPASLPDRSEAALARLGRDARRAAGAPHLAALGWVPAALAPAYSAERKQQFSIEYVWDEAQRQGAVDGLSRRRAAARGVRHSASWSAA